MSLVVGNIRARLNSLKKGLQLPSGYHELLQELKRRIRTAQVRAGLAVSRELVLFIGRSAGISASVLRPRGGEARSMSV
jgi:hypothetical protein